MLVDDDHALDEAERIGYPVLIKPSAGGGGRGMRMVRSPRELQQALTICRSEAQAAFGDDSLYLEKWLEENRHVEVQVIVDRYGNGVHVGERDCSVQRRHQKIVEEAPTPALAEAMRQTARARAPWRPWSLPATRTSGTLEFLLDRDGNFYFIEINCRIQVEHPVTEMLSGMDLVAEQIRIAAGEPLGYSQDAVRLDGHAIEFRINAEDVAHDFRPQAGTVGAYLAPGGPGVRMDSHLYAGYEVPPYYDSLLGKLVVWAADRPAAIARSRIALERAGHRRPGHQRRRSIGRSSTTRRSSTAPSRPTSSTASAVPPSWLAVADPEVRPARPRQHEDPMTDAPSAGSTGDPLASPGRRPQHPGDRGAHPAPLAVPARRSHRRVRPGARSASWARRA